MNEHNYGGTLTEAERTMALKDLAEELASKVPGMDWAELLGVAPDETPDVDDVLTIRRTLGAFAELIQADPGTIVRLSTIAHFVSGLTDGELLGLSDRAMTSAVADVALSGQDARTRAVVVNGLSSIADGLLELSIGLDLALNGPDALRGIDLLRDL